VEEILMASLLPEVGVGLLGLGTVGAEVYRLLVERAEHIAGLVGRPCVVRRVAVARPGRQRRVRIPSSLLTSDGAAVVEDPAVDIVVEVMGGVDPARSLLLRALAGGKAVVTANKQLLAAHGAELLAAAASGGVDLCFEASVGAGIPLIKPLRESLAADRLRLIEGILNGTTNYILTLMSREGRTFAEALAEAQARGFAEADPADDVDGHDAAAKLAILAAVAFNTPIAAEQVYREGIGGITPADIRHAAELGYTIKLLAVARDRDGALELRVHPALIPVGHLLAGIAEERNAVLVEGDACGRVLFSGPGAGGAPTAAAVVGDIIDAARNRLRGAGGRTLSAPSVRRDIHPMERLVIPFYLRLQVTDRPGVFARIAAVFGEEQVSIASIVQKSRGEVADVILLTHEAEEAAMRRVVARLRAMDVVQVVGSVIRVVE